LENNFEDVIKRLSYDQWLDYYDEIKALALFRDSVFETINKTKRQVVDIPQPKYIVTEYV
jgi:hypothetical protein